jgi:hypothetical protein
MFPIIGSILSVIIFFLFSVLSFFSGYPEYSILRMVLERLLGHHGVAFVFSLLFFMFSFSYTIGWQ